MVPGAGKVASTSDHGESFRREAGFLDPVRVLSPSGRTYLHKALWTGNWEDISWRVEALFVSMLTLDSADIQNVFLHSTE